MAKRRKKSLPEVKPYNKLHLVIGEFVCFLLWLVFMSIFITLGAIPAAIYALSALSLWLLSGLSWILKGVKYSMAWVVEASPISKMVDRVQTWLEPTK